MAEPTLLEKLRATRQTQVDAWDALIQAREAEHSAFEERMASEAKPDDAAIEAFRSAQAAFEDDSTARETDIKALDERIRLQSDIVTRRVAAAAAAIPDLRVVEPLTYRKDNGNEYSYFRDLAASYDKTAASRMRRAEGAQERLQRHGMEMDAEMPKRAAERERNAQAAVEAAEHEFRGSFRQGVAKRGLDVSPFERRVNPNRTDGQGGYFVPPLWLEEEYIPYLRAGRVAAGLCHSMDLPEGTDSINIPVLSTPTAVGIQGNDGSGVLSQDIADSVVTANVKTLAGQEDVAIQLLDQSPGGLMDRVIMQDLLAAYNQQVDLQVIQGNGTNSASLNGGQVKGIYPQTNWTSTNTITWTTSSFLPAAFNQAMGAAASKLAYNRFDLTNVHFLMHPRRWFWFATAVDGASATSGRPIVTAQDFGPFNASVLEQSNVPFEGLAGRLPFGPNAYIDANVPTTDNGAGVLSSTKDVAIGAKWDDCWLFEGALRTRVLPEVLSGTLEVRFQVYNYVAFLVRYGQSLALIEGTGMAPPVSAIDASIAY